MFRSGRIDYFSVQSPKFRAAGRRLRELQACVLQQSMCTFPAHLVTFALEEGSDSLVTKPGVLSCQQSPHRIDHRRVTSRSCWLIAQQGTGHAHQLARPSLRMVPLNCQGHLPSTHLRAHHFRRLISLSVSIAISRSASILFRRVFSA